ncbi:MAG: ferredoxin reductase, partial [Thalassococcus sp.]|uniref:oxidoreductase C-terminal domain-containing protein n=1 Tax=Thalassococcus sp. TaxID=1928858 RepID=UPI001B2D1623
FELDAKGRLVAAAGIATGNTIAKDIKLAERMINARQCPDPERLADPADPLKKLMRDAVAL